MSNLKIPKIRDKEKYTKIVESLTSCPFCVLKDKYILAEDGGVVLTMNLFPYIDYHLMLIPRRHVEKLKDLTDEEFIAIKHLQYVASKLLSKKGIKDLHMLYREGENADKSVGHLHVHLIPYRNKVLEKNPQPLKYEVVDSAKKLKKHTAYIKEKLDKIRISGNLV